MKNDFMRLLIEFQIFKSHSKLMVKSGVGKVESDRVSVSEIRVRAREMGLDTKHATLCNAKSCRIVKHQN